MYESEFTDKNFLLDKFFKPKVKKSNENKLINKAKKPLSKVDFTKLKYEDFLKINEHWKNYITLLVDPK